jgi:K+-transporting ATPase ATPase B chain
VPDSHDHRRLLSAIGVAGMSRMMQANVIATSGRAVEAAGDVDVLLLDKTGTITLGNRQAAAFHPGARRDRAGARDAAQLASLADETPKDAASSCSRSSASTCASATCTSLGATFVPFSAHTRMSGVDIGERQVRKGAPMPFKSTSKALGQVFPKSILTNRAGRVARRRAARRCWCDGTRVLGVIELKDIVKGGIKERFAELRAWASRRS